MPPIEPKNRPSLSPRHRWEALGLLLCLALAAWFLHIRIAAAPLPSGDEGSWLAAAAELADGNGFKTRWLEFHYLTPYDVPRPDDMRFPVLTSVLALWLKVAGPSFTGARILTGLIFLAFMAAAWFAVRLRWGAAVAFLTAWLMALSPMQLQWSSFVMCEGIFGLTLSLWLIWIQKEREDRTLHWAVSGALVAVLCLVRTNGLLLLPGVMLGALHAQDWKRPFIKPFLKACKPMLAAVAGFLLVASPWFLRNWSVFGNPFHVGGSAGLLRASHDQDATLSLWQFLAQHGIIFPVQRIVFGFARMFEALQFYEHGLQWLPLAFCFIALIRRRAFFPASAAWGFGISYAACLYAAYNSWAGVRYFSPFIPFLYAYGLAQVMDLASRPCPVLPAPLDRRPWMPGFKLAVIALALSLPVINPHRYYVRHYSAQAPTPMQEVGEYLRQLDGLLPEGGIYMARTLCQVNYMGRGRCVGLQGPDMEEWLPRALTRFNPALLALSPAEQSDAFGKALFKGLESSGLRADPVFSNGIAALYRIAPPGPAPVSLPDSGGKLP